MLHFRSFTTREFTHTLSGCKLINFRECSPFQALCQNLDLFKVIFYGLYHGKSQLNPPFGIYFLAPEK